MSSLQNTIDGIGAELVRCSDGCAGIWCNQANGIVPRTLFLERSEATGPGCYAVGLNPGTSKHRERAFYRQHRQNGVSYDHVKEYRRSICDIRYFRMTRTIIDQLGLRGPIIWSNLAKCENAEGQKDPPPVQTMRHCAGRFLRRELEVAPPDWAVLAIGLHAFVALAYLATGRAVIGIPHTTGSRNFRMLFEGNDVNGLLRREIRERACAALAATEAVWLAPALHNPGSDRSSRPEPGPSLPDRPEPGPSPPSRGRDEFGNLANSQGGRINAAVKRTGRTPRSLDDLAREASTLEDPIDGQRVLRHLKHWINEGKGIGPHVRGDQITGFYFE